MATAVADFRPQNATFGFGVQTVAQAAASEWVVADAIDRFPIRADAIGMTSTPGHADISSSMTGLIGETQGPRTTIEHGEPVTVPFGPDLFNVGAIAFHAGAHKTGVILGADAAFQQQISPDETDVVLTSRFLSGLQDARDGNPRLWNPMGVQGIVWNFAQGEIVTLDYTFLPLYVRYYGLVNVEAGSATQPMLIRGWLNPTTNALADKNLFLKVTAFATPNATVLAAFAATPAGSVTFNVIAGLDDEFRPRWTEVPDGDGLPAGVDIGTADVKFECALLDDGDVTVLDEYSWQNPADAPMVVRPTTPTFTVSAACIIFDGTKIADLESSVLTTVNDLVSVPGGACGAMPQSFDRQGASTAELTIERRNTTFRDQTINLDDREFEVRIEGRTNILVDGAGANGDVFDFELTLPTCKLIGTPWFAFTSAADTTKSLTIRASPAAGSPQWKLLIKTQFLDPLA